MQQGRRDFPDVADHLADAAEFGFVAGRDGHTQRVALRDQRTGINHVETVTQRGVDGNGVDMFGNRLRFAGQRGFIDRKVVFVDQADVGGNAVSGHERDDVAGHDFFARNGHALAVTDNGRFQREHFPDGFQRAFGFAFLDESDNGVDHNHPGNDARIDPVAEYAGYDGRNKQHIDQDVVELEEEAHERTARFGGRQQVQAEFTKPFFDLVSGKSFFSGFKARHDLIGRHGVPGQRHREPLVFYGNFLVQLALLYGSAGFGSPAGRRVESECFPCLASIKTLIPSRFDLYPDELPERSRQTRILSPFEANYTLK